MGLSTSAQFNPVLSEALNKIGEQSFVGTRILPGRPVFTKTGVYPVFEASLFDNDLAKERAPGTQFARTDFTYGQQDYKIRQYGLEAPIPDEDETKAVDDGIDDARGSIAMMLQRNLMVGHERRVADLVYEANFNSTSQTGAVMSDTSSAKPIVTIQKAVQRLGGNGFNDRLALIIEESLYFEMLNTDEVRSIFNGDSTYVDEGVVRSALGVNEIIVTPTRYNSAAKGKAASRAKVWPTDKYLVAQIAGGDFSNGGIGRTLTYEFDGGVFTAEEYREEAQKSDVLRVYNSVDEVVINPLAGELITSA